MFKSRIHIEPTFHTTPLKNNIAHARIHYKRAKKKIERAVCSAILSVLISHVLQLK